MEHYLLIVRSVTHAQSIVRAVDRCGIRSSMLRAPTGLTDRGCSYGVRIRAMDHEAARECLQQAGLMPMRIYGRESSGYREVTW